MAHQIDFTTGQAAIAYATGTETPWHGLGQTVDPHAPVEVWQKAAQLEWPCARQCPTHLGAGGRRESTVP